MGNKATTPRPKAPKKVMLHATKLQMAKQWFWRFVDKANQWTIVLDFKGANGIIVDPYRTPS